MHRREKRARFKERMSVQNIANGQSRLDAAAHCNVAREALEAGHAEESLAACRNALDAGSNDPGVYLTIGTILTSLTRFDDARGAFEQAVTLKPDEVEAIISIGTILYRQNKFGDALAVLEGATALRSADLQFMLGVIYQAEYRLEEAAEAFSRAGEINPSRMDSKCKLLTILSLLGRHDEAIAECRLLVDAAPSNVPVTMTLAEVLLRSGDGQEAVIACDDFLNRGVYNGGILGLKVVALNEANQPDASRQMGGYDTLLIRRTVRPADKFTTVDGFNAALASAARAHPQFVKNSPEYTTRNGGQTGNLFIDAPTRLVEFKTLLQAEIGDYIRALPKAPEHPFISARPKIVDVQGWAVFLECEGYQDTHNHPNSWLSGVYYLSLPNCVAEDDDAQQGWIEFGRPKEDFNCRAEPIVEVLCPVAGDLVLFPSYLYHRTIPFTAPKQRISIAFDVVEAE
jgi:uncharacterized protein (TIGR02466 family)